MSSNVHVQVKNRIDTSGTRFAVHTARSRTGQVGEPGAVHPDLKACLLEVVALRTQLQAQATTIADLQQQLDDARAEVLASTHRRAHTDSQAAQLEAITQEHQQHASRLGRKLSSAQARITVRLTQQQSAEARYSSCTVLEHAQHDAQGRPAARDRHPPGRRKRGADVVAQGAASTRAIVGNHVRVVCSSFTHNAHNRCSRVRARGVAPSTATPSGDVLLARVQWRDEAMRRKDALLAARTSMLRQVKAQHEQEVAALRQELAQLRAHGGEA